jgi:outer membrane protein OmpA-like peptidoglycan-associated protein
MVAGDHELVTVWLRMQKFAPAPGLVERAANAAVAGVDQDVAGRDLDLVAMEAVRVADEDEPGAIGHARAGQYFTNLRGPCMLALVLSHAKTLLAAVAGVLLAGCGPRVFEGASAKVIESSAPPPPIVEKAKPEPRVEITDDKIVIREKIQFERNKARILPVSDGLLAEIAAVMNQHPRIKKIRVEGHASADGGHKHNVELSKRRADAVVDHLVRHGQVAPERLESEGYGPDRPIADNETEAGREANRRVEFTIVEQEYTQTKKTIDTQTGSTKVETEKKVE